MILLDPGAIKSSKDLKRASEMMDIKNLKVYSELQSKLKKTFNRAITHVNRQI